MMFASKTPRDLNFDPEPWREKDCARVATWSETKINGGARHDPRTEFDHVQHNEPNPILVEFRGDFDGDMRGWSMWLILAREEMLEDGRCTLDHYEHARRVLARLANLTKETA